MLRIAALLHDVGKPRTRAFSDNGELRLSQSHNRVGARSPIPSASASSPAERTRIVHLVRHHLFHFDNWSDAAVRRWIIRVSKDRIDDLMRLSEADLRTKGPRSTLESSPRCTPSRLTSSASSPRAPPSPQSDLAVDGNVLIKELGIKPGRRRRRSCSARPPRGGHRDPAVNTKDTLLARARAFVASRQS